MRHLVIALFGAVAASAMDEPPLPEAVRGEDFEPTLNLYEAAGWDVAGNPPPPAPDLVAARKKAERLKTRAERWQRLHRSGIVSAEEADRAAQLACDAALESARAGLRSVIDDPASTPEARDDARTAAADAERLHAETSLTIAQRRAERQRRLHRAGLASKTAVTRADAAVTTARQRLDATMKPASPGSTPSPTPAHE